MDLEKNISWDKELSETELTPHCPQQLQKFLDIFYYYHFFNFFKFFITTLIFIFITYYYLEKKTLFLK